MRARDWHFRAVAVRNRFVLIDSLAFPYPHPAAACYVAAHLTLATDSLIRAIRGRGEPAYIHNPLLPAQPRRRRRQPAVSSISLAHKDNHRLLCLCVALVFLYD
jgi:hypothetical protein